MRYLHGHGLLTAHDLNTPEMRRGLIARTSRVGGCTPLLRGGIGAAAKMGYFLKLGLRSLPVLQTWVRRRFGAFLEKLYNFGRFDLLDVGPFLV